MHVFALKPIWDIVNLNEELGEGIGSDLNDMYSYSRT